MKKLLFFFIIPISIVLGVFYFGKSANAGVILQDDFEEGASWTYATHWDTDYGQGSHIHTISTNPHSGTYCAETDDWYVGGTIGDNPMFIYGNLPTDVDQIFIRFWFKAGVNYSNYWNEFVRFTASFGIDETEIGSGVDYGNSTLVHIYNGNYADVTEDTIWGNYPAATSWNEYAILIDYANNKCKLWKNGGPGYTDGSATIISGSPLYDGKYWRVVLPTYLKREPPGSLDTIFYMDDIEIWDGIPSADTAPPAPPSGVVVI